jgi:penicillin-binding protein 1B
VIAWVGFDDNRDLGLEGARSALPIWTDFMLKAYQVHPVRDPARMFFAPPPGVEMVTVDGDFREAFIVGTAPNVRS